MSVDETLAGGKAGVATPPRTAEEVVEWFNEHEYDYERDALVSVTDMVKGLLSEVGPLSENSKGQLRAIVEGVARYQYHDIRCEANAEGSVNWTKVTNNLAGQIARTFEQAGYKVATTKI